MLSKTSTGSDTSPTGELANSFLRLVPLGILAAAGRLSVEAPNDATDSDDVLGFKPGRRGSVLGPSWTDRRGVPGDSARLGEAEGVDWDDCPEKRSNHMTTLRKTAA